jgi:osmotically-inducible protein OsmY
MIKPHHESRTVLTIAILILTIVSAASFALADSEAALMNRVNAALRSNPRLNGAKAYTAAEGVVVLYGTVFDDKDRALAEKTANTVAGVNSVVDNLRTKTGKWAQEEERINSQLLSSGFADVQARVIGPYIYLSGRVTRQADKDRAATVALSVYPNKQIDNMIWVQPGSMF